MNDFLAFPGNCPHNVAKDAKYTIRSGKTGSVVALTYRAKDGERWHATTEDHPDLVEMVNAVKRAKTDSQHGPFYINEYHQVIVPVGSEADYYLAGEYSESLRFEFEGKILSGEAVDLDGQRLNPGDPWDGPHPGIPYVLTAGGKDIYYRTSLRPNVTKDVKLSNAIGPHQAATIARRIRAMKGFAGGRFYVNEWGTMFAPINKPPEVEYVYLGQLVLEDGWFPKPDVGS